jgi:hypothetical protein
MANALSRLVDMGFVCAGKWSLSTRGLELDLDPGIAAKRNVLYGFMVNGSLAYLGKTARTSQKRMQCYKTLATTAKKGGSTNIKVNRNIVDALSQGQSVDIYTLVDHARWSYGGFPINLAAALEDGMLEELDPPWNGQRLVSFNAVTAQAAGDAPPIGKLSLDAKKSHDEALNRSKRLIIKYSQQVKGKPRLTKADFTHALRKALMEASDAGKAYVDIRSGDLHAEVGNYPGKGHSMPTCCSAMRDAMRVGDEVLAQPPKRNGARVVIRYLLPRR